MAEVSKPHDLPPTPPPPPSYSRPFNHSHSSQGFPLQESVSLVHEAEFDENKSLPPRPVQPGSRPTTAPQRPVLETAVPKFHAEVQIHSPDAVRPSSQSRFDFSGTPAAVKAVPRRKPLSNRDMNPSEAVHRRVASDQASIHISPASPGESSPSMRQVQPEADAPSENFEPLQYHHQSVEGGSIRAIEKRASKLTIGTTQSDGSGGSDPNQLGLPGLRNSHLGADLPRPDSGFSSTSDLRGRTLSPALSPSGQLRAGSHTSRSPDARPLSYVDLLNVPYPQAPPSGAENLVNQSLRSVVGDNASLLSTRRTLEMYRANVKKTNDPAIQYEFAIFMISAAQEDMMDEEQIAELRKGGKPIKDSLLKEARQILQKLCDRSYPFAQYYLADGYASGLFNNGKPDLDRSFPLFLAASKHGHAEAMYRTALCYEWGWGCRVDAAKAVQFYQHAASKNHPGAMLRLGRACLTGEMGLVNKYREGIRWLKRGSESADFQYNQAPYDLGCLHETGYGPDVFKDESYAAQLFTKAADLGHKEAAFRLGEAYEYGQLNCPKDPALSVHFYTGAAEQDHAPAQMALCAWYMVGVENVLEKDENEAYEWAKRAAENGLAKAQYTLGYFTEMGIGCRRDALEANVWYVRAADQGEDRAKHRIAAIRAAAAGATPMTATSKKAPNGKQNGSSNDATTNAAADGDKKKRFGIF